MEVEKAPGGAVPTRLGEGAESAISAAYAEYADAVRAYARRYVGPDEADDVVQRTFLDAWRSASRYDPRQRFSSWLFTIAHHRAVDVLRARRGTTVDIEALRELCGEDGRETVEKHADAVDVRQALARVPEHERSVLELMYFEELTQRETAERLSLPIGTVKARASRGTRRLAEILRASSQEKEQS